MTEVDVKEIDNEEPKEETIPEPIQEETPKLVLASLFYHFCLGYSGCWVFIPPDFAIVWCINNI